MKTLGLLHTSATLVPVFKELCARHLANRDLAYFNLSDDSLIQTVIRDGALSPLTRRRVAEHIRSLVDAGADVVLVTCSSIGPAVDEAAPTVDIPVLRVDRPMAEAAVARASRIGVLATLTTTLAPTTDLIRTVAAESGKEVQLRDECVAGAFDALMAGNPQEHDARVSAALRDLARHVDVVVLAQASMARVADQLPEGAVAVPVLSSPERAVRHLAEHG
ncbi:MAG: aspartate/glutamate racemase family protein [Opitutales bacterium]